MILGDMLSNKNKGYNVIVTQDLSEAKKFASQKSPLVIICDACLPDGTSWKQVFETMVGKNKNPRPVFIVCSKSVDQSLCLEVLDYGAHHDTLNKPFKPREVDWVVRSAITKSAIIQDDVE
jgi:DNA-binding response OmpR family regulator